MSITVPLSIIWLSLWGVIAGSSRGVSFADSSWINSASSAPFELVIASQVILYRLTGLTIHPGWESRSKRKLPYGLKHANFQQCIALSVVLWQEGEEGVCVFGVGGASYWHTVGSSGFCCRTPLYQVCCRLTRVLVHTAPKFTELQKNVGQHLTKDKSFGCTLSSLYLFLWTLLSWRVYWNRTGTVSIIWFKETYLHFASVYSEGGAARCLQICLSGGVFLLSSCTRGFSPGTFTFLP